MGCQKGFEGRLFLPRFHTEVVFTKKTTFVSQMAVVAQKVLWRVPPTVLLQLVSQSRSGFKVAWVVDISHIIH